MQAPTTANHNAAIGFNDPPIRPAATRWPAFTAFNGLLTGLVQADLFGHASLTLYVRGCDPHRMILLDINLINAAKLLNRHSVREFDVA